MLGRVDGVEFDAATLDGMQLTVFTPHKDAVAQGEFVAMSPSHPEIDAWVADDDVRAQLERVRRAGVQRDDRSVDAAPLIETGRALGDPGFAKPLPVVITSAVDDRYGYTAVLGIPAVDKVDASLAKRVKPRRRSRGRCRRAARSCATLPATAPATSRSRVSAHGARRSRSSTARRAARCRCRSTSCRCACPTDLRPTGAGNALAEREDFIACACPKCGAAARRETDTLDCHVDGLWQWLPFSVPAAEREGSMFTSEELKRWLPVHIVIWGADGGGSMFDQRMTAKVLRDAEHACRTSPTASRTAGS